MHASGFFGHDGDGRVTAGGQSGSWGSCSGQEITRTKLVNLDTLLISTGTIREVPEKSVRACRTQIVTEVGDAAKMVRNWGGGVLEGGTMTLLHRVVFYGNHMQSIEDLATLMGTKVVVEG